MTDTADEFPEAGVLLRAVHGLYEASVPEGPPRALPLIEARALAGEAADALGRVPGVHRLVRLHAVASATNRRPALVLDDSEGRTVAVAFARIVLATGDPAEDRTEDEVVDGIIAFAEGAREADGDDGPGPLTPRRWEVFLATTRDPDAPRPLGPAGPMALAAPPLGAARRPSIVVGKPGCNDTPTIETATGDASTVRSRFRVDRDLASVKRFIDPALWDDCGWPFWASMTARGEHVATSAAGDVTVREGAYEEVVVLPFVGRVTAHLWTRYEEAPTYAIAEYRLDATPGRNEQVTFDSGWLYATTADAQGGTYVEGLKVVRFADDEWNRYADLVCDGGWAYFMINMALDGAAWPPGPARGEQHPVAGEAAPGSEVAGRLQGIVDDWFAGAAATLDEQRAATRTAVARAMAAPPDPRWVNDVVGMGHAPVAVTRNTVGAVRRALAELGKLGGAR